MAGGRIAWLQGDHLAIAAARTRVPPEFPISPSPCGIRANFVWAKANRGVQVLQGVLVFTQRGENTGWVAVVAAETGSKTNRLGVVGQGEVILTKHQIGESANDKVSRFLGIRRNDAEGIDLNRFLVVCLLRRRQIGRQRHDPRQRDEKWEEKEPLHPAPL